MTISKKIGRRQSLGDSGFTETTRGLPYLQFANLPDNPVTSSQRFTVRPLSP